MEVIDVTELNSLNLEIVLLEKNAKIDQSITSSRWSSAKNETAAVQPKNEMIMKNRFKKPTGFGELLEMCVAEKI